MYMAHSNRLVWPQQWHTQTRCADGLLLLHIYSVDYLYAPAVVNCEVGSIALTTTMSPWREGAFFVASSFTLAAGLFFALHVSLA